MAAVRKAFTTGGTEEHGVWPRCERLSPRGARRCTGYGHAAKGFTTGARRCTGYGRGAKGLHHGVHGGARGLAALRKAFTTAARRCTGSGSHGEGFSQQLPK